MKLNAIGIVCSDLPKSLAFYAALDIQFDDGEGHPGHREADLGGGIRLMLDSEEVMASFVDGFTTPKGNDRISLAVECESPEAVDAAYDRILGLGHESVVPPFDAPWQQRYATVSDPDGNHVDLYAPLP